MEPTNLNPPPPDDDELEAWLRANATATPLPDDGFSIRVLTALPARKEHPNAKRKLFCLAGAVLGMAVAAVGVTSSGDLPDDLPTLNPALTDAFAQLATPAAGWALVITIVSLWFAFSPRRRFLPRF